VAWGIDYRCIQRKQEFERWITVLTALEDGRVLSVWTNNRRPELEEARQVLAFGIAKHPRPDVIWCDAYFAKWVAPIVAQYDIRLHLRVSDVRTHTAPIALPNPRDGQTFARHATRQVRFGRVMFAGRWFTSPALRRLADGRDVDVTPASDGSTRLMIHDADDGHLLCDAELEQAAVEPESIASRFAQRIVSFFAVEAAPHSDGAA